MEVGAMPKETIKSASGMFNLEVCWGSYGTVQLGVSMDPKTSDEPQHLAELVESWTAANGVGPTHKSLWVDMPNRAEINRLIRVLRNARDKTYGRDE